MLFAMPLKKRLASSTNDSRSSSMQEPLLRSTDFLPQRTRPSHLGDGRTWERILDFRFWILDLKKATGHRVSIPASNPKIKIQNPKSKRSYHTQTRSQEC